jgi:hypothetical protein
MRIETEDDEEKLWDDRKLALLLVTIRILDANAAQYRVYADRIVPI